MESEGTAKGKIEERILAAAADLFSHRGYSGVSTREIAVAAGLNEVTIYRHYPRKRDLYLAVLAEELGRVPLRGDRLREIVEAADAHQALMRAFALIETAVKERPRLLPLALYGALEAATDADALLRRHLGEFVEVVTHYVDPWVNEGSSGGRPLFQSARGLVLALVSIAVFRQSLARVFGAASPADGTAEEFFSLCIRFGPKEAGSATGEEIEDEEQPGRSARTRQSTLVPPRVRNRK